MKNNIIVVIRSVGERTEQACYGIVNSQLGNQDNIFIIRNKPFSDAHFESIKLAIEQQTKWALFLDADILLRNNAINKMIVKAENISSPFLMLNFRVLDYIFGNPTYGVHLYNSEYLMKGLEFKDRAIKAQRPETFVCQEMANYYGIPSIASDEIVGIHGFEQWYEDVYRTMFVRAVKFSHKFNFVFQRVYNRYLEEPKDKESQLILHAYLDGILYHIHHNTAPLDKSYYTNFYGKVRDLLTIIERPPLEIDQNRIEEIISSFEPDDLFLENESWLCPNGYITDHKIPFLKKVKRKSYKFLQKMKLCIRILFLNANNQNV